jgi:hypothetical protein
VRLDNDLQRIEAVCLDNARVPNTVVDRVDQRLAKKWMIVSDDKCA